MGIVTDPRGWEKGLAETGLGKVQAEWRLICLTHNLLKLFRAGWTPQPA